MRRMDKHTATLLAEIDAFLEETGMGVAYFGKRAAGNSELVARLRAGRRCWPETAVKVRSFIKAERKQRSRPAPAQGEAA